MTVSVIDVDASDLAAFRTALEKVVADAAADGEALLAMTAVPGSSSIAVVTGRAQGSSPSEELERFATLRDANAIGLLEYDEIKKRLIASL